MKYNSETPQHIIDEVISRNDARWKQLNDLILSVIADGVKFLFFVNAGGSIAMLTFIGTSSDVRSQEWPWTVMSILFLGVIFLGALHFARYHSIDYLISAWKKDLNAFYSGKTEYEVLISNDDNRVRKTTWILIFAYLSFICFIIAGFVGYSNYKNFIQEKNKMTKGMTVNSDDDLRKNHVPRPTPVAPPPQPPKESSIKNK